VIPTVDLAGLIAGLLIFKNKAVKAFRGKKAFMGMKAVKAMTA
jgi:hypothetical protein